MAYCSVRLLNGFSQTLWYRVPPALTKECRQHIIVAVPLQKRVELAVVITVAEQCGYQGDLSGVRDIIDIHVHHDPAYQYFIERLSAYHALSPWLLYQRLHAMMRQKPQDLSLLQESLAPARAVVLTDEQQAVVDAVAPCIRTGGYTPFLVHGVTGSGKSECYKKLLEQAFCEGKSALFLLPEVSLAVQFTSILKNHLSSCVVMGFHSATTSSEKRLLWQRCMNGDPVIVVGVHLPVLLPLSRLGVIIVDEEHEIGYQEKKYPHINSKEAALLRAHVYKIPIVLGSATPSVSSLYNVAHKGWRFFSITKRFAGAFPEIKIVSLTQERKREFFWLSKDLQEALADRIAKKEQSIIFLNRRGYSFFVQCSACAFMYTCNACSVSLTLHEDDSLRCHYCDIKQKFLTTCPQCKKNAWLKKGVGTQQIVLMLSKIFPHARIVRADLDTTKNKKKWQAILHDIHEGNVDIIVGTQTITKGYHFSRVTLVGIIWADMNLHFPVYHAAESSLQQLIQVAGRAGRQSAHSLVLVQVFKSQPLFDFIDEQKYMSFVEQEMQLRTQLRYPPACRLAEIEFRHDSEEIVEAESDRYAEILFCCAQAFGQVVILGPASPPVKKIKNIHIRKLYIKADNMQTIHALYMKVNKQFTGDCFVAFTPNPLS